MSHVKLKRLKINKYRNVRPGTELHFDDGVNLILGQNGSGKTTLLGLIAAVAGNNFSLLGDESFDVEYDLSNGTSTSSAKVRDSGAQQAGDTLDDAVVERTDNSPLTGDDSFNIAVARRSPRFHYSITLTTTTDGYFYTYKLDGTPDATVISVGDESSSIRVQPFPPSQVDFILQALLAAYNLRVKPAYEAALTLSPFNIFRFDESLDTFLAMTGRQPAVRLAYAPPVSAFRVASIRGERGPSTWRRRVFTPRGLMTAIHQAQDNPAGELKLLPFDGIATENPLDFLQRAATTIGFQSAALKPEVKLIQALAHESHQHIEGSGFSFSFTRNDGTIIHHDLLSYGQKRLLAFFYYLAATDDVVIADELVNGLHHRWIEACMKAIADRQAFLTSQNPLLFDYVEFDSIEQVQARFITCKTEIVDGAEQLVWQNMPRDDAARFYEAYTDEIEQVGEILITRGLW